MTSYFQDGGREVISRGKVLPSGACTRDVCTRRTLHPPAAH